MGYLLLDYQSAFFIIPLLPLERGWFVIKFKGKYYIFPTIWARVSGLMGRLTQGMFDEREVSINTFVDDPLTVLSGPAARRARHMAMIILVGRALGFPLSFAKRGRGTRSRMDRHKVQAARCGSGVLDQGSHP